MSNLDRLIGNASEADVMREVPRPTLSDDTLDKGKCREAVEAALASAEPNEPFNRDTWLAKTKDQLKRHPSARQ